MEVSVIIPMYNEEENVNSTVCRVAGVLASLRDWEILTVDDGSSDGTGELLRELAARESRIRVLSHAANMGRGRALRTGFAHAEKDIVVTLDADLSYDPELVPKLAAELESGELDIVVGSPYMKGGAVRGVPLGRLLLSRLGNKILAFALPGKLHTVTGILRAYRKKVIESLELESNDKEIHLEILSKALALGHSVKEVPALLQGRKRGKSKLKLRRTVLSHLMFSFYEKPAMLFGGIGLMMSLAGVLLGGYLFGVWLKGELNPDRPLMAVTVTLIVAGIQIFFFGFVSTQIARLRRDLYKIQGKSSKTKDGNCFEPKDYDSLSIIAGGRRKLD